jgi:heme-degrading monooxygenase HmoA
VSQIVTLPTPPYYAVIAPAELTDELTGYPSTARQMVEHASAIDGFHGIEMCAQPGFSLAVSYWRDLEAIHAWRTHSEHMRAKRLARATWFSGYATRIAQVIDAY